jgi:hypothetical protein
MLLSFMRTWRATGLSAASSSRQLLCKQQVRLMYVLLLLLLMYKMVMSIHWEGREGGREAFKVLTSWFS